MIQLWEVRIDMKKICVTIIMELRKYRICSLLCDQHVDVDACLITL